jgi:antirestriction protein ArdC
VAQAVVVEGGHAPKNAVSNKEYRGFNVLVLVSAGFTSPYWMTFKQPARWAAA